MIARRRVLAGAALAPFAVRAADGELPALERIKKRGILSVAVYQDMPPFHVAGKGIDVELAHALAEGLGVKASLLPVQADEELADDLRHAVWRGHYLGWGPADVMLHVPVDPPLMDANPQVLIFAPYYRERVLMAWDRERGAAPTSMADLKGLPIAVPGQSLAGWLMLGAEQGALRATLSTTHADGTAAAAALKAGKAVVAVGLASELESALAGLPRYQVMALPTPRARDGWAVGMAVKKDATDLARALQARVNELSAGTALREIFKRHGVAWAG